MIRFNFPVVIMNYNFNNINDILKLLGSTLKERDGYALEEAILRCQDVFTYA